MSLALPFLVALPWLVECSVALQQPPEASLIQHDQMTLAAAFLGTAVDPNNVFTREFRGMGTAAMLAPLFIIVGLAFVYGAYALWAERAAGGAAENWVPAGRCCSYGAAIVVSLALYGLVQERVMAHPYGGVYFNVSLFLVLCNRVVAVGYAVSMAVARGEPFINKAPLWKYLAVSVSNVAATTCQYEALVYVAFPVQMLAKSFKMMPVMAWGMVISGKTYKARDWLIGGAVTWGVTQFLLTGTISSARHHGQDNIQGTSAMGLVLLGGFLACDGFTSAFQERLFSQHNTSKYNQMLYVNLGSALISLTTLLVLGLLPSALAFCDAHPEILVHIAALSSTAVVGQFFIYSQVQEFGALVLAATMNLRQVISVMISYLTYGHPITLLQILGLFFVFAALFYKSYLAFTEKDDRKSQMKNVDDVEATKGEMEPLRASSTPGAAY